MTPGPSQVRESLSRDVDTLLAYLQELADDEPESVPPDSAGEESPLCPHEGGAMKNEGRGCAGQGGRGSCAHHAADE